MRRPERANWLILLVALSAWSGIVNTNVDAQQLGDQPLSVPGSTASAEAGEVLRLPAVAARRSSAPRADVVRFPDTQYEIPVYVVAPVAEYLPNYVTPREQFVPTAWLRWAQQADDAAASGAAPQNGAANGEENKDKKPEIGAKPPEEVNKLALRGTNLLLKPGDLQYELSPLFVTQQREVLGLLPDSSITIERVRNHLILLPIAVRYGWTENTELFAVTPFGLSLAEADNAARNLDDQTGVLGDISLGFVRNLSRFKAIPNTTLSVNLTTPTGVAPDLALSTNQAALGNGVWRVGAMLNFIQSVDPFVLYGGLGLDHPFPKDVGALSLQFGEAFNFYAGCGFAVTDDVSLSAQLNGSLQGESQLGGVHIPNSDTEPVSVRLALMRRLTLKSRVQPFISWGVTEDAADYSGGVRFVHDR